MTAQAKPQPEVWQPGPLESVTNCLDGSLKRAAYLLRSTQHAGDAIDASRLEYLRAHLFGLVGASAGRSLPVVEMPEPSPEPLSFREAFAAIMPAPLKTIFVEPAMVDQPEAEIAALEREHMGDPDKGTGIYAMPFPGCRCEACVPMGNPFDEATRENVRMILCATCGNKRCPHATDHRNACTGSNAPGQKGSSWENVKPWPTSESITMIEKTDAEVEAARVLATSPLSQ